MNISKKSEGKIKTVMCNIVDSKGKNHQFIVKTTEENIKNPTILKDIIQKEYQKQLEKEGDKK